ncbi:sugar phosphate isomerase/epimerase family protein [Stappia stellulata]|uniref:sugar phosphate isomerase/epimerase family protein n=1 Tax=Stappia stellulata TaxID=71235 RepID=UPI0003F6909E|nr:sugar phosphate isomerase/epimerase [Stappia stellulata]
MNIAIAPCCWGIYWPTGNTLGWTDYLDRIVAAGYRHTELGPYGYFSTDPEVLSRELDRRGLSAVAAAHVHTLADAATSAALAERTHQICSLLKSVGGTHFILMDESEFYPKDRMGVVDEDGWRAVVGSTLLSARIVREYGLQFSFHPHVGTCIEHEDQIERLLAETDPDLVGICLDTGHHAYWKADPKAFFLRHKARINSIHLKNVDGAFREKVLAENIHCDSAFEDGIMTDLDRGAVDIADFMRAVAASGYDGPLVVEQDLAPKHPEPPEAIAARNFTFVSSLVAERAGK